MANEAAPISPARFALALKDLPLSTLHLKVAELRNSIAHLDYSNEQLKPFADGAEGPNGPDADCADAIRENEVVIARMLERIEMLKAEVEGRGSRWLESQSAEELGGEEGLESGTREERTEADVEMGERRQDERSEAWRDGTFQRVWVVNGDLRVDGANGVNGTASGNINGSVGGRLDDEASRRALAEEVDDDEGRHL